jgi:hypothetical protein
MDSVANQDQLDHRLPHMVRARVMVLLVCLASPLTSVIAAAAVGQPPVSFDREIRPILSDKCFRCHGPDANAREADMRLDVRGAIPEHVLVPGEPEESELVRRIMSEDASERMPPPDSRLSLSAEQKRLLRRWIAEGAPYSEHWSFVPLPASVEMPAVDDDEWPRGAIDRFVLARLDAEKLAPTPPADPLRLLRRVTLDLTGLPPTEEECRTFEKAATDDLDTALEDTVDRLLASPRYGEHLAVAWLDAARYADSYGYQSDQLNTQWPYRDWVVRALNANMPYDRFLTCQLAGDLLPNATRDQILATAFNRLHRLTNEGGSIAEEWLVENAADRVQTLGTAVLGLTLECSRCHDHKYDPITQRDYYSLFAFFNSIDENGMYDSAAKVPSPTLLLPTKEQEENLNAARQKIANAQAALAKTMDDGGERFDAWVAAPPVEDRQPVDLVDYVSFNDKPPQNPNDLPTKNSAQNADQLHHVEGVQGQAVRLDGDRGVVVAKQLNLDRWDAFSVDGWIRDTVRNPRPVVLMQRTFGTDVGYNGFDVMLADGVIEVRLYRVWPGNGIGVRAQLPIAASKWQHLAVTYDGSSRAAGLRLYLNGQELPTTVLRDEIHKSASVATYGDGSFTLGARFRDRGFKGGEIDELRVFGRAVTPLEVRDLHDGHALADAMAQSRANEKELQRYYFSAIDPESRQLAKTLREARKELVTIEDTVQEVPVMEELPEPRPAYILARGAYDAPKSDANRVGRDTFEHILIPFPADAPRNRLGLARWLTDPRHPLTARVFVNRLWANFFGRPIVATPENFGRQGAQPTHPELLDWLARDFMDHGWDIKRLCREIVMSATYRQDSQCSSELRERDPENLLLARGPSHRLSAEQIRDLALAAAGLLVNKIGGPPVSPYQPGDDLWREANTMSPPYRQSVGKELYRRSIYSVWKRTAPLPNMLAFDAPTREVCTVSRSRTNTPLQALVLLNDVQFVEAARALATAVALEHDELGEQIRAAFLRLTGRRPDEVELDLLTKLYYGQQKLFADRTQQDALEFIQLGEAQPDPTLAPADVAALAVTCQAILNLDATIFER